MLARCAFDCANSMHNKRTLPCPPPHPLRAINTPSQVTLNCLLLDCLAAADRWQDALAHCRALRRAPPPLLSSQRPLAARVAACIAHAGGSRGAEEMVRLQADVVVPEVKVCAWIAGFGGLGNHPPV